MQPCSKLWCTGKARGQLVCQTRHFPWADATSCGNNKLCYQGACTDQNSTMHIMVRVGKSVSVSSITNVDTYTWNYFFCLRWMVSGASGVHMETAPEVVVQEFSWPRESVTTLRLRMEANTATAYASSTAPVTTILVQKQVKVSAITGMNSCNWLFAKPLNTLV